jgi:hypothetical protein
VDGHTGYTTYLNALIEGLVVGGHTVDAIQLAYPTSGFVKENSDPYLYAGVDKDEEIYEHVVMKDSKLGAALFEECSKYDLVILHATVPLPEYFVIHLEDKSFKLLVVVHDTLFCNATYGNDGCANVHYTKWDLDYLLHDPIHRVALERVYSAWCNGNKPELIEGDLSKLLRKYLRVFYSADAVICPSIQVKNLIQQCWRLVWDLIDEPNLQVVSHSIPHIQIGTTQNLTHVCTVASWDKVDWKSVIKCSGHLPYYEFHVFCSEAMRSEIKEEFKKIPKNVILVPTLSRNEFFSYLREHNIGQCIHLTKIFETFSFIPYEMSELGIRTVLVDNGSATETAIKTLGLEEFSVPTTYTVSDVVGYMTKEKNAWTKPIRSTPQIKEYVSQLLELAN